MLQISIQRNKREICLEYLPPKIILRWTLKFHWQMHANIDLDFRRKCSARRDLINNKSAERCSGFLKITVC